MFRPTFESLENRTLMAADLGLNAVVAPARPTVQVEVAIHAEKNQGIHVENDETHWVGHDLIGGRAANRERTETVNNNETITVSLARGALCNNEVIEGLKASGSEIAIESMSLVRDAAHAAAVQQLLPYMEQGNIYRLAGQQANANGIIAILIGLRASRPQASPSILASNEYFSILGRSASVTHDAEFESWANSLRSGRPSSLAAPKPWYVPELDSDSSAM